MTTNVRYSDNLLSSLNRTNIKPNIVLEIDGFSFYIGSSTIKKRAAYGDAGLEYGDDGLVYGGLIDHPNQKTLISLEGTTTSINQKLEPDKARGSSVSSMSIVLSDLNQEATKIVSGFYGEILYKDVKVWLGFSEKSAFDEDYLLVFRGLIEKASSEQGKIKLSLASPDQKRRQSTALKGDTSLTSTINDSVNTIAIDSTDNFFVVPNHPDYSSKDDDLKSYVKIGDEIIEYTGISGSNLTGCVRGSLGTTPDSHTAGDQAETFFVLEGNALELALKIMLSDKDLTPYVSALDASSVGVVDGVTTSNVFYFAGVDIQRKYNVRNGDYVKSTGFTDAANNLASYTQITGVTVVESGSYITVNATLNYETPTSGNVTFLSKYNSLGDFGLGMNQEEVDIDKHEIYIDNFLADANVRFFVRDEIDEAKEFIELELYKPFACYSLPSDKQGLSRLSVGYHIPPLPIEQIVTLDENNISNPDRLIMERSVNAYHYNAVGFVYEDSATSEDFTRRQFILVGTPLIPTGNKTLKIESKGLKADLSAQTQATRAASRLLDRYKGAAEVYPNMNISFSSGVIVNIGDIVVLDPSNLKLVNRDTFKRDLDSQLYEVINKKTDIKTGKTNVTLINTSFDINQRIGLVAPTSKVVTVLSQTRFELEHPIGSAFSKYGASEGSKWVNYVGGSVEIYNEDFSQSDTAIIESVSGNVMEIDAAPAFTVVAGTHFIKFSDYSDQPTAVKLVFCFLSNGTNNFSDGGIPYTII